MSESTCATCGHSESAHDAGECWWDSILRSEVNQDTPHRCRCSWWEPKPTVRYGSGIGDGEAK